MIASVMIQGGVPPSGVREKSLPNLPTRTPDPQRPLAPSEVLRQVSDGSCRSS